MDYGPQEMQMLQLGESMPFYDSTFDPLSGYY